MFYCFREPIAERTETRLVYKEVYIEGSRTGLIDSTFNYVSQGSYLTVSFNRSIHAELMETGQL